MALAGAFGVKVDKTTTLAFIDQGAKINQRGSFANGAQNPTQDVTVVADNQVEVDGLSGAGAISLIGSVGLGADITIVRNTTTSFIGKNVRLNAGRDLAVTALSGRDIDTAAIAGAGGLAVGAAGSLNLVSIGSPLDSQGKGELGNNNGDSIGAIDQESSRDYAADHNSGEKGQMATSSYRTAHQGESAATSTDGIDGHLNENATTSLDQSQAYIGQSSSITTGRDIVVKAQDSTRLRAIAGGAALGAVALGGWFAVGIVHTTAQAFSQDNVTLNAGRKYHHHLPA